MFSVFEKKLYFNSLNKMADAMANYPEGGMNEFSFMTCF